MSKPKLSKSNEKIAGEMLDDLGKELDALMTENAILKAKIALYERRYGMIKGDNEPA